jgi:hypothetical protein
VRTLALGVAVALLAAGSAEAAPRLQKVAGTVDAPVGIAGPPGDASRMMVVQQGGKVRVVRDGAVQAAPFLDVSGLVLTGEERGLLSIAFPPDYQQSGLFYVYLTARDNENGADGHIEVREYRRADADHADPASERLVLSFEHPHEFHNGGDMHFGPDGLLWIASGNALDDGASQDTGSLLGKILRIDPRRSGSGAYTVPAGNPFHNEVWAYGLRNPWRFSFDRATGDLMIADVGENEHEEIDFAAAPDRGAGANYGWPCREGAFGGPGSCLAGARTDPVIDHRHSDGWTAIVGGYVVRDPGLPTLAGRYVYGDIAQDHLYSAVLPNSSTDGPTGLAITALSAMGEDACGHLYAASLNNAVYQLVDGAPSACSLPPQPGPASSCNVTTTTSKRRGVARRRWLPVRVRADKACRVTITGRIPHAGRFRTARRTLPAGRPVTIKLRLTKRVANALRRQLRHKRSVTVKLRVVGVASGQRSVITRRAKLRR